MDNILLSAALAFIICFFSIPVIIEVAKEKKLYDEPDERKVHKQVIPTLGGIGIFAGFILALLMGIPAAENPEFQYFIASLMLIFFMGLHDDIMNLSAAKKFIGQVISAGIIIRFGLVNIQNMQGFLGIYEIPTLASYALSLFTIIVVMNAFNLIDGIDGLAGSLGLISTVGLGIYFYLIGSISFAVMAFSLAATILAFLIFNFNPAKIFMGDTGSLIIGTVCAILVIKFIQVAPYATGALKIQPSPALGFAFLMVPLFDTLRVFTIRIFKRRSPFSADRNHIHHFLLDLGFCHKTITFVMSGAAIFFIVLAYLLKELDTTLSIFILLGFASLLTTIVYQLRKKKILTARSEGLQKIKPQNIRPVKTEMLEAK